MTGLGRSVLLAAAIAGALAAVLGVLVPELPPLDILGGDARHYAAMAEHPFDPVAPPPYAERLGATLVVAALPFATGTGFFVLGTLSLVAAAVFVALVCRHFGWPLRLQAAAATLVTGSYIGVHTLFNQYYVDPETLAVVALALFLAVTRRTALVVLTLVVGVAVKEIAVTLVVLPYALWRQPGKIWDGRAAVRAAALAVPVLAAFAAVQLLAPHLPAVDGDGRLSQTYTGVLARGVVTSVLNPIPALFGAAFVLWPLGALAGPQALRRAHLWALVAVPILVLGSWERTMAVLLPLAVPAALFVLRSAPGAVLLAFVAGSVWASGVVSALTIGEGETSIPHKLALLAPGLALAWGAVAWEVRRARGRGGLSALLARDGPA